MFFWRKPKILGVLVLLAMIGLPLLYVHPAFRVQEATKTSDVISVSPLSTRRTLNHVRSWLSDGGLAYLRDGWGLTYGPMSSEGLKKLHIQSEGKVSKRRFGRNRMVTVDIRHFKAKLDSLQDGVTALNQQAFNQARQRLARYYDSTFEEAYSSEDELSYMEVQDERILFGLIRYHRALAQLESASHNNGDETLLQDALYNLRRTIAALERLGYRGPRLSGGTYWGDDTPAWVGNQLNPQHGDITMHHIYSNLATAYLRLGHRETGYPEFDPKYLEREQRKYTYAEDQDLGPHVQRLFSLCLERHASLPVPMLRLSMALHNMEAAARGIDNRQDTAIFHYMTGLLLFHLSDYEESHINYQVPLQFFDRAIQASKAGDPVHLMAQKEKVLVLILLERYDQAFSLLEVLATQDLSNLFMGPQKDTTARFTDLFLLTEHSIANLDGVIERTNQRRGEAFNPEHRAELDGLYQILVNGFFHELPKAMYQSKVQPGLGLRVLEKDPRIVQDATLGLAFNQECRRYLMMNPLVVANYTIQANAISPVMWWVIKIALTVFLLAMVLDAFVAHRRVGSDLLNHGYK